MNCPTCGSDDADLPCAYPGEGKTGCLRDRRLRAGLNERVAGVKTTQLGMGLVVDKERLHLEPTGVFIRARLDGKVNSYDIAHLEKASLLRWLRSSGGANPLAENMVGILLGHGHLHK